MLYVRPIPSLPVGYKVVAALIHHRLIAGGADDKITASQFGFRPKRNCMDALMVVRRMIDAATEQKQHGLLMIFLDWAKAFDRIQVGGLVSALKRFGLHKSYFLCSRLFWSIGGLLARNRYCTRLSFITVSIHNGPDGDVP